MTRQEFEGIASGLIPIVRKVGLSFFRDDAEADDVVQESLLRLWRYCESIDPQRSVEGLAVRVAKNVCVSIHRQRQDDRFVSIDGSEDTGLSVMEARASSARETAGGLSASPQEQMERTELRAMVDEAVARLHPRERELFEMRQLEGLTLDEIAERTGVAKPSAKAMISAARRKVLDELKRRIKL